MSNSGPGPGDGRANGLCFPVSRDPEPGATEARAADMPLLDLSVLQRLEEELGDAGIAQAFASDYIGLWDKRIQYLMRSVAANDHDAAMDAVLSMKNSAFMVGGARLAGLAVELEGIIRNLDLSSAPARVAAIAEVGQATIKALQDCYLVRD
jgi:hypothetical protein